MKKSDKRGNRYSPKKRASIVALARNLRATGKTWSEVFEIVKSQGYKGTRNSLEQMMFQEKRKAAERAVRAVTKAIDREAKRNKRANAMKAADALIADVFVPKRPKRKTHAALDREVNRIARERGAGVYIIPDHHSAATPHMATVQKRMAADTRLKDAENALKRAVLDLGIIRATEILNDMARTN